MRRITRTSHSIAAIGFFCAVSLLHTAAAADMHGKALPVPVRVVRQGNGWQLQRGGKPYRVKGVGGRGQLDMMVASGVNSLRTWGADNLNPLLDDAHERGLTVAVGIWLGHERHGFDYTGGKSVAEQEETARKAILRYRNHPAVLLWGIGNEMEGFEAGDNPAIWMAVNRIAAIAHELDPLHPTMTTTAEIGGRRVASVHRYCPDIDIMAINSYAGSRSLPERYRESGGTKPYIITEFGPPGPWEVRKTAFGAPLEPTSTAKAKFYADAYRALRADHELYLGSYAFLWGHKQEATATWFGMFLPDGSKLGAVDAMTELWSGHKPGNLCPVIDEIKLAGEDVAKPEVEIAVAMKAHDPEGDPVAVDWLLQRDAQTYNTAGDVQAVPHVVEGALIRGDITGATFKLPRDGGKFRIFAYLHDGKGGAAVANVPIKIDAPERPVPAARAKLPFDVYREAGDPLPYLPSGWMGNTDAIASELGCTDNPHSGKTCVRVDYKANDKWGGIVWMHPDNDWGDRAGGFDLFGAGKLTLWARGAEGGEKVKFGFGIIGREKRYYDTAKGEIEVTLTKDWKSYTFDLADQDLSRIKTGFVWSVAGQGRPLTFYLDDIRYEAE